MYKPGSTADRLRTKIAAKNKFSRESNATKSNLLVERVEASNDLELQASQFYSNSQCTIAIELYNQLLLDLTGIKSELESGSYPSLNIQLTQPIANAYSMLGHCYRKLQQPDKAKELLEKAQEIDISYDQANICIVLARIAYAQCRYDESYIHIKSAIKASIHDSSEKIEAIYFQGVLLSTKMVETLETSEAILFMLKKGIKLFRGEAYANIGIYLFELERHSEAEQYLKIALSLEIHAAHKPLSIIYKQRNEIEKYIFHLKAIASAEHAPEAFNLAYLYDTGEHEPYLNKDVELALYWYNVSMSGGLPNAYHNMGYKYLHGEDVPQDIERGDKLLITSAEMGHISSYIELAAYYDRTVDTLEECEKLDRLKKIEQLCRAGYVNKYPTAGHNLACVLIKQNLNVTSSVDKESLEQEAIAIWSDTNQENHPSSNYNLGLIHDNGLHGMPRNYSLAYKYYEKAAQLGVSSAYSNLAVLIYQEAIHIKDNTDSNSLFSLFKKIVSSKKDDHPALMLIYNTLNAHNGWDNIDEEILKKIRIHKKKLYILSNITVMDIINSNDLKPERKLQLLLDFPLDENVDIINIATIFLNINKLLTNNDFSLRILFESKANIMAKIEWVHKEIVYIDIRSAIDIMKGVLALQIDTSSLLLKNFLSNLLVRINHLLSDGSTLSTVVQNVELINVLAKMGIKSNELVINIYVKLIDNIASYSNLSADLASKTLFSIALLDCFYKETKGDEQTLLFSVDNINLIISRLDIAANYKVLSQTYMGLKFLSEYYTIDSANNNLVTHLLHGSTMEKIKSNNVHVRISKLQKQVVAKLREIFPHLREEIFVDIFPVDVFIDGISIVQINGPKHFLFDLANQVKSATPKELLRRHILDSRSNIPTVDINFDEWDRITQPAEHMELINLKFAEQQLSTSLHARVQKIDLIAYATSSAVLPGVSYSSVVFDSDAKMQASSSAHSAHEHKSSSITNHAGLNEKVCQPILSHSLKDQQLPTGKKKHKKKSKNRHT
ncbi:MAG: hypothetical protein HON32_01500 [Francisellaceae bacterium]|nr:hypothetical protein [Francisellaceae bacterium]